MFPKLPLGVLSNNSLKISQDPLAQLLRILSLVNEPFLKLEMTNMQV